MIKRPLDPRFPQKVKAGIKITTIRKKPWPVGVPIMLYCWSGAAYRSKQIDVAAVEVEFVQGIDIAHDPQGIRYSIAAVAKRPLWQCEGFDSQADMDAWFAAAVKPGETVFMHLMRFKLLP